MADPGSPTGANTAPSALTFPAPLFRHISPSLYLHRHLLHTPPTRPSGRHPHTHRPFTLTTSSLSHAHGSAVIRTGDTAVVCGIRGEILTLAPGDDHKSYESYSDDSDTGGASWGGLIVPNIELSTGCSKHYPLGPPSEFAQALAQRLNDLIDITKVVDLTALRIYDDDDFAPPSVRREEGSVVKGFWTLYVDVLCISLDGNILDGAWLAIMSALSSTQLPLARWNADEEMIVCSPETTHLQSLTLRSSLPVVATFAIIPVPPSLVEADEADGRVKEQKPRTFILSDPDAYEEAQAQQFVTLVVSEDIRVARDEMDMDVESEPAIERIETIGGRELRVEGMAVCVKLASDRAKEFGSRIRREKQMSSI